MQRNRVYFFISFALILGLLLFLTPSWAFAICTDNDGDGYAIEGGVCGEIDCDDSDPNVYPGAKKLCDGKDTNCDGRRDFKTDVDADGDGVVWCAGDCDDNDPNRFPGNPEVCDGIDNDCNGILLSTEHDSDKDGYRLCDPIPDCNDFDASVYPGADEICGDNKDNNCDGTIDEAGCICPDSDADGQTADFCGGTDCDDSDPNVYLGAVENCTDGIDNDCDGLIDLADPNAVNCPTCTDNDADGYAIDGGVCGPIDCDDSDPNVYPGAPEICDGKDSNCDGRQVSTDVDNDGDGVAWCAGDCDDTNPNMFPGNPEVCDGIDNDCNGVIPTDERDADGDGYRLCDPIPDCNDFDASVYPGADEICGDNKDNNCDGTIDEAGCICPDSDADGQTADFCGGTDCDDSDPNVYLGAVENCTDGIDNDCDGLIDLADPNAVNCPTCTDNDADGYAIDGGVCGPIDCDDSDPNVYPGAPEICDGKDSNCDGRQVSTDVDNDGDGVAWCAGDCDDTNPNMFPGNQEGPYGDITCSDGIDNDCDTRIDEYDGDCAAPTCTTKTTPKDGPHMFNLLNPIDDSVIKLSCDWCHYDDSGTIDQRTECQRCHADPNDPSDPLNGVLKQLYPLSPPYGFGTAPNVKLHSSSVVGTKYGNWDMDCLNCHNPHLQEQDAKYGTTYGKYIKEYICFDNTVTGQSFEEFIEFTASSGPGSFADGPPYNENICEMCHTQTNHHRRTGDAPGDLDGIGNYIGHYDGIKCTDCHVHEEGFKPSCGSCHDAPPPTGTHLKHFGGTKDDAEYGSTAITQDYTSYDTKYLINCGNCHPIDPSNHINGVPNSGGGDAEIELYNPNAPAGSLKARNPSTATYTPGTIVYTDSKGFKYTLGTCSNVYCHSYTEFSTSGEVPEPTVPPLYPPLVYDPPWETFVVTTTRYQTPTWGVDSLGCDGCHGYPIQTEYPTVSAGVGDSHAWVDDYGYVDLHIWNMGFGPLQCNTCHYDTVREDFMWTQDDLGFVTLTDIPIYNTAKHVNGSKDVAFTPIPVLYQTSLGDVYHSLTDATFNPNTKTCYNVSCHKYQTEVKWGSPYRWWIGVECNVCHQM